MRTYLYSTYIRFTVLLFIVTTVPFIHVIAQSANNACASAVTLTSNVNCTTTSSHLQDATNASGEYAGVGCSASGKDVWFKFVAQSATTTINVNITGSNLTSTSTYVEVLSGTCGSFTTISCQNVNSSLVTSTLTVGQTYYVRVYIANVTNSSNPSSKWGFDICVTHPAPPPSNDNCAGATSLTSGTSCTNTAGTVLGATNSGVAVPSCGGTADDDVWYKFTAVQPYTTITLSSVGTALNSSGIGIELFSGSCGSLTSLDCSSSNTLTENPLTIGATYYVRVYSAGSTPLTSNAGFNICVTHVVPPANDNCAGAVTLTANTSCTNTAGTVAYATNSSVAVSTCGGTADDDVWYKFTATVSPLTTISLSGLGSNLNASGAVLELFSGACGSLTSIGCSTGGTISQSLTSGTVYYIRVYSAGSTTITSTGGFNICVATTAPAVPANVAVGKSFINISKPNGGTVSPGDVLEIRVSVNVSNYGSNLIFRTRYNDTIPTNLTYLAGSLKLLTNESKLYAAYSDAAGDDFAMYDGATKTVRFNLGRDTVGVNTGAVSSTAIDSASGGYYNSNTHRPRANGMLVLVTYRVTVNAAVAYNTIINYGSGAIRYRNQKASAGAIDYTVNPNSLSFIIAQDYGLCSNATGLNYISAGNGNFSSGTALNGASPGGTVPGYTFTAIGTGAPQDGLYSVIKNLSPSQSTNPFIARPESTSTNRVFGVWDIIGDHTGAADPLAGNPPPASGANGGYMLAVNAAYQLSIANNQTISGLCENTFYEFSAWVRNVCKRCGADSLGNYASNLPVAASYIPTAAGDSSGVKPNLTFQIDGTDYYTTGNLDYIGTWGQWVKKGFVFKTNTGQTSLTISIKNNAPGGGGNDWVLDDISLATCLPSLQMTPSNSPTYCNNASVNLSVIVSTFYNNYNYYQWERSTDGGSSWSSAPELPGTQTYSYVFNGTNYLDTVALPTFIATSAVNGYKYRIRTSTSLANLSANSCSIYNSADIITVGINSGCAVLPAEVLNFNVQMKDNHATLLWKAKQEMNLLSYIIERSSDGIHFAAAGSVAARGAGDNEAQYLFNDPAEVSGKVYYRLKLSGIEGSGKYSNVLSVSSNQAKHFEVSNLVNPFDSKISFQLSADQNEQVELQLLDASGRPLTRKIISINKGVNAVVVDPPASLQRGSYLLRVISGSGVVNKVIQKQ